MTMSFAFTGPGWLTLRIERQLDVTSAPMICAALRTCAAGEESNVLIDLDAVDAADEHGIAALVSAVKRVRDDHPGVQIAILAQRSLLADSIARKLSAGVAAIYRDRDAASAEMISRAAA